MRVGPSAGCLEVLFERPMEQLGDFTAVVAERSTTPCPKDNDVIVDRLHPHFSLDNSERVSKSLRTLTSQGHDQPFHVSQISEQVFIADKRDRFAPAEISKP
ncbi:MAG: hypothetical protein ABSF52_07460 [Syntrophobacteraceae bacterium]|jgi:hypothetical protein